jgi:small ligand-binding sensory domain FIST
MSTTITNGLKFASALSTNAAWTKAIDEVCRAVTASLGGPADLAVLFTSHHHGPDILPFAGIASGFLETKNLLGCTGESIVGVGQEIENRPALSLWAAKLPGTRIRTMHLQFERTPEGSSFVGWPDELSGEWPSGATLLVLAEPFSFPADGLLHRLNEDRPGAMVLGGMASGGVAPGQNRLLLGSQELKEGAVAALLVGGARVRPVVSQGCRPIGKPMVITKADRHVIYELGGRPPLAVLRDLYPTISPTEQKSVEGGVHIGRVTDEYRDQFLRGDFLVRNVIGVDGQTGAMAVGDFVRAGQTVQFHIRDAESADEDLRELLGRVKSEAAPAGGLLFTCNGRGTRLFDQPHHDAQVVRSLLGEIPLAGFFAQGEIGPIGAKNYLHGFTASLALFEG